MAAMLSLEKAARSINQMAAQVSSRSGLSTRTAVFFIQKISPIRIGRLCQVEIFRDRQHPLHGAQAGCTLT